MSGTTKLQEARKAQEDTLDHKDIPDIRAIPVHPGRLDRAGLTESRGRAG